MQWTKYLSRTWVMVAFMVLFSSYLAYDRNWSASDIALLWGVVQGIWVGGKAWQSKLEKDAAQ